MQSGTSMEKILKNIPGLARAERIISERGDVGGAKRLVPVFYFFLFYAAFLNLEGLHHQLATRNFAIFIPRWPIFWADWITPESATIIIFVGWTLSALAAAFFYRHRIARIAGFVGFLQFHAYQSSFGFPHHQWDIWMWVAFLWMFLPDIWNVAEDDERGQQRRSAFLSVFWGAQAYVLLTYSLSGLGKLLSVASQATAGMAHTFSFDIASLHISQMMLRRQETTVLGPLFLEYELLGWALFISVVYLEVVSVIVVFRPDTHRLWGLFLALFHLGTFLTMRAVFVGPVALLMILFFESPFMRSGVSLSEQVAGIPLLGRPFSFALGFLKRGST